MSGEDNEGGYKDEILSPINLNKTSVSKKDLGTGSFINQQKKCCNCKQSKCIKLYCECYASGVYCTNTCNCIDCWNNQNYEDHRKAAIQTTLEKNPSAFQPKISTPNFMEFKYAEEKANFGKHSKGCSCKKSGCMKKYCECFQAKIPCSDLCKCVDCHNTKEYYENQNGKILQLDEIKQEDLIDNNSFFLKILLASEGDDLVDTIDTYKSTINNLNLKKGGNILTNQYIEEIFYKLMMLIDQNPNEISKRDIDIKDIMNIKKYSQEKRYKDLNIINQKDDMQNIQSLSSSTSSNPNDKKTNNNNIISNVNQEHELVCEDEKLDDLPPSNDMGKGINLECDNEETKDFKLKTTNIISPVENNELNEQKQISFYKLKKNLILREFISILQSIDS